MPKFAKYAFGPITVNNWKNIPVFTGRLATMEDVNSNKAIFCTIKAEGQLCDIDLPFCAIYTERETGQGFPVVAVQAEMVHKEVILGVVQMDRSTLVCTLSEVEIVKEPNEAFFASSNRGLRKLWQRLRSTLNTQDSNLQRKRRP